MSLLKKNKSTIQGCYVLSKSMEQYIKTVIDRENKRPSNKRWDFNTNLAKLRAIQGRIKMLQIEFEVEFPEMARKRNPPNNSPEEKQGGGL